MYFAKQRMGPTGGRELWFDCEEAAVNAELTATSQGVASLGMVLRWRRRTMFLNVRPGSRRALELEVNLELSIYLR